MHGLEQFSRLLVFFTGHDNFETSAIKTRWSKTFQCITSVSACTGLKLGYVCESPTEKKQKYRFGAELLLFQNHGSHSTRKNLGKGACALTLFQAAARNVVSPSLFMRK